MTDTDDHDEQYHRDGLMIPETGVTFSWDGLKSYWHSTNIWELLFSLTFVLVAAMMEFLSPEPRQRIIPYQQLDSTGEFVVNQMFNESFNGETVSSTALYVLGIILPLTIQVLISFRIRQNDLHKTACVYFTAIGITCIVTSAVKLYVGYLRPIFYDVCVPDDTFQYCSSEHENEARKSFPSGHASISFCGLALLSFYLEGRFGASSVRMWQHDLATGEFRLTQLRPIRTERIISICCYAPFLLACFIAASRVADNKHFPADVVGGAVLGTSIANFVHGVWFS